MKTKKILLHENADKSDAFLEEVKVKLIDPIHSIVIKIEKNGIELNESMIKKVLQGDTTLISEQAGALVKDEQSEFVREQRVKSIMSIFPEIVRRVATIKQEKIGGRFDINNPFLKGIWEFEKGKIRIPESKVEEIREAFREYVASDRVAVYEAHQAAAKSIEKLLDELHNAGLTFGFAAPAMLIRGLVEFKEKPDGKYTVSAKQISYNY